MSKLTLPQTPVELRQAIRTAIEFYQGNPAKNDNKLNEAMAKALGFDNYDQLAPLLNDDDPIETYKIEYESNLGEDQLIINGQRIDTTLVHEGIVDYTVADAEDRENELRRWIGEAVADNRPNDVYLMEQDLDTLRNSREVWALEAHGTNGFITADGDPELFNKTCDEMIGAAREHYEDLIGERGQTGKKLEDIECYWGNEEFPYVYEGELVLLREERMNDDELPYHMPRYKYEGSVPKGFVAAFFGSEGEWMPIIINE